MEIKREKNLICKGIFKSDIVLRTHVLHIYKILIENQAIGNYYQWPFLFGNNQQVGLSRVFTIRIVQGVNK